MKLQLKFSFIFTIFLHFDWICSLKLTGTQIPYYGIKGRELTLDCHFDLENDTLYALKWYKDGHEFFRFNPRGHPPITVFQIQGVSVNEKHSTMHKVQLHPLTMDSQGEYRCEISAEAPSFQTVEEEKMLRIMVLPEKGPKITGIHPWYNVGDTLTAYCNTTRSFPEAILHWFVNKVEVKAEVDIKPTNIENESVKFRNQSILIYSSNSTIQFQIDSNYFRDGTITIECRATFPKSTTILYDYVITNVKSGFGFQYADSLSKAYKNNNNLILILISLLIVIL